MNKIQYIISKKKKKKKSSLYIFIYLFDEEEEEEEGGCEGGNLPFGINAGSGGSLAPVLVTRWSGTAGSTAAAAGLLGADAEKEEGRQGLFGDGAGEGEKDAPRDGGRAGEGAARGMGLLRLEDGS